MGLVEAAACTDRLAGLGIMHLPTRIGYDRGSMVRAPRT